MCPDFPSKKGLDPSVWTNAKAGQIDAAISGRAPSSEYDTQLDANVSTRAPSGEYDTQLDANVSTRSSHNAAAVATEILVDPGTDKIDGSQIDASVASRAPSSEYDTEMARVDVVVSGRAPASEYDVQLDANISTRAPASEYDTQLDANMSTRAPSSEYDTEMAKVLTIPYFETPVEGTLLMDASEQILIEKTEDIAGLLEGIINLAVLEAGDTVVVREYMQTLSTGTYELYAEETYSDVQDIPILQILTRISMHDVKVSIEQTAGTNRTFEYSFVRRRET